MDNTDQNQHNQPVNSSQPEKSHEPSSVQAHVEQFTPGFEVPVISSAASLHSDATTITKKTVLSGVTIVIIVVILLGIAIFQIANSAHHIKVSTSNKSSTKSSSQNPLNNGSSINQQVKYCSNIVNANTVC